MIEMLFAIGLLIITTLILWGQRSAYLSGVIDGYGAAREPWNISYKSARDYLRKTRQCRWPDLQEEWKLR